MDTEKNTKSLIQKRIGLKEYIRRQKVSRSCINDFKKTLTKGFQIGGVIGLCLGPYLTYRHKLNKSVTHVARVTLFSTLASVTAFSGAAFMCGIFNCMMIDETP